MSNSLKKTFSALAFAGAALVSATAAQAALTVPAGGSAFQPVAGFVGKTTFNDSYSFELSGLSNLTGFAFSSLVSGFKVSLISGATTTLLFSGPGPGSFASTNLGPGEYSLNFSGTGNTRFFSGYAGAFKITPAVPEPATVALGLMAAGLLGGLALRKKRNR